MSGAVATREALRERGFRATSQRLMVERALEALGRHASAEEVLDRVRELLPGVSLPTVYSALDVLEEAGLVRRIAAGRGAALYDARPFDHHHLVCRRCGSVEDLAAAPRLEAVLAEARRREFDAESAEVVVHGLCGRCRDAAHSSASDAPGSST